MTAVSDGAGAEASDTWLVGTDGACSGNPGPAGWAWVAQDGSAHAGAVPRGTNQSAELSAVLLALQDFPDRPLTIQSDSAYAIGCSTTWKAGWQRVNYQRSSSPIANLDVIRPIHQLLDSRRFPVQFVKVKGHDPGNRWPLNTAADEVSVAAVDRVRTLGRPYDERLSVTLRPGPLTGPDAGRPVAATLTLTAVKDRPGWTDKAVGQFLGEPDELRRNTRYPGAAPARLYLLSRVTAVENGAEWVDWLATRRGTSTPLELF